MWQPLMNSKINSNAMPYMWAIGRILMIESPGNSHSSIENIVKELNQFENVNIELQQNELIVK